jgi:hypothetical protein
MRFQKFHKLIMFKDKKENRMRHSEAAALKYRLQHHAKIS